MSDSLRDAGRSLSGNVSPDGLLVMLSDDQKLALANRAIELIDEKARPGTIHFWGGSGRTHAEGGFDIELLFPCGASQRILTAAPGPLAVFSTVRPPRAPWVTCEDCLKTWEPFEVEHRRRGQEERQREADRRRLQTQARRRDETLSHHGLAATPTGRQPGDVQRYLEQQRQVSAYQLQRQQALQQEAAAAAALQAQLHEVIASGQAAERGWCPTTGCPASARSALSRPERPCFTNPSGLACTCCDTCRLTCDGGPATPSVGSEDLHA